MVTEKHKEEKKEKLFLKCAEMKEDSLIRFRIR